MNHVSDHTRRSGQRLESSLEQRKESARLTALFLKLLSGITLVLGLMVSIPSARASEPATASDSSTQSISVPAAKPTTSDEAASYAAREKKDGTLEKFHGGDSALYITIGSSAVVIILVIILVVVLL